MGETLRNKLGAAEARPTSQLLWSGKPLLRLATQSIRQGRKAGMVILATRLLMFFTELSLQHGPLVHASITPLPSVRTLAAELANSSTGVRELLT
jgi:hypothetical protein